MSQDITRKLDRRRLLILAGGAGIAGLAGCSTTDTDVNGEGGGESDGDGSTQTTTGGNDQSGPYRIGMVDSATGSLSEFGERNQRGKDLALAMVNDAGIDGRELEVVVEDSGSQDSGGVSAAQKLVNQDSVPFLIGAVGSGVSLAIYESVVQNSDVVQLSQNSTGLGLTKFPGLLRMSPTGRTQATALASIIADNGYNDVAITYVNNNYGQSLAEAFANVWQRGRPPRRGSIAYNGPHDQDQQSYSDVVSEMNDSGADAWLFVTYQAEFATMVNELFSSGYEPSLYGADSVSGDNVLETTPEGSIPDMTIVVPSAPTEQENYQTFAERFESEYGEAPTVWSAYAYDCVVTAALSIQTADGFTAAALGEVVRDVTQPGGEPVTSYQAAADILADCGGPSDIDYQGVSGPIDLDENGGPTGFFQVLTVDDHSYQPTGFLES